MTKTIKSFSIDRAKWGKGLLLRGDGKMCCLGHLGVACGVPLHDMRGHAVPSEIRHTQKFPKPFRDDRLCSTKTVVIATDINDHEKMSLKEKEYRLKILFRAHGIKLTFRGKRK